jgi:hypothetical protein
VNKFVSFLEGNKVEGNKEIRNLRKICVVECERSCQMSSLRGRELERGVDVTY